MFSIRIDILPTIPNPPAMLQRFSISDLSNVLVNKVAATNTNVKNTRPMINRIRLEKSNSKTRR